MKNLIVILLLCGGMARANVEDVATSTDTFAICKSLDVASTAYIIEHGLGVEANTIIAGTLQYGYVPFILLSVAVWWFLKQADSKPANLVANTVTCGAAVHNLLLIP